MTQGGIKLKKALGVDNSKEGHSVPQRRKLLGFHAYAIQLLRPFMQVDESSRKKLVCEIEER